MAKGKNGWQPTITPAYEFEFKKQIFCIGRMQLTPGTKPISAPFMKCPCKEPDCIGWNTAPMNPIEALGIMGHCINLLIDERDSLAKQLAPGEN